MKAETTHPRLRHANRALQALSKIQGLNSKGNESRTYSDSICPLMRRIAELRILVVGAGGIGCELLKSLAMIGVASTYVEEREKKGEIVVVDLDTIDVSNLNRQFLFRRRHVGMSKSLVAIESISEFLGGDGAVRVKSIVGNVTSREFGVSFVDEFDLVINALDNWKARQHMNRLCLATHTPLLEAGSTGWDGQVQVILGGVTECFECNPAPTTPSFPVCTIRSTPEKPEHCIAWAKLVLEAMFGGNKQTQEDVAPKLDWASEAASSGRSVHFALAAVNTLFKELMEQRVKDDLEAESRGEQTSTKGKPITPIDWKRDFGLATVENQHQMFPSANLVSWTEKEINWFREASKKTNKLNIVDALTLRQSVVLFLHSVERIIRERIPNEATIVFSKDDCDTMDFVAAAANLRASNFSIPLNSRFKLQSIAGAIVPAIATTNATVASLQVNQLVNLVASSMRRSITSHGNSDAPLKRTDMDVSLCMNIWVVPSNPNSVGKYALLGQKLDVPSARCYVCSDRDVRVKVADFDQVTLKQFIDSILIQKLGLNIPNIEFCNALIFEGEPDEDDLETVQNRANSTLSELDIMDNSQLWVTDDSQGDVSIRVALLLDANLDRNIYPSGMCLIDGMESTSTTAQPQVSSPKKPSKSSPKTSPKISPKRSPKRSPKHSPRPVKRSFESGLAGVDERHEKFLEERQNKKRGKVEIDGPIELD